MSEGAEQADPAKQEIRERIWRALVRAKVARFPGARGRIPNFTGAEQAARLAAELYDFARARVLKMNPDSPQRLLRQLALEQGKRIYMAVPRLRALECFLELDPRRLAGRAREASTIDGAERLGRPRRIGELEPIDLVVCGSVAVNAKGHRLGKGGGYSVLEWALAADRGLVTPRMPVLTTVHPLQLVDADLPRLEHDLAVTLIVTADEIVRPPRRLQQPRGILWERLRPGMWEEIPVLRQVAPARITRGPGGGSRFRS